MKFFFSKEDIKLDLDISVSSKTNKIQYDFQGVPEDATELDSSLIYFTTSKNLDTILEQIAIRDKNGVLYELDEVSKDDFPIEIDVSKKIEDTIKPLLKKKQKEVSIGIVNCSSGMGDQINFLRAMNILCDRLLNYFDDVKVDVYQILSERVTPLNIQEPWIRNVYQLPCKVNHLEKNDLYVDFSGFASCSSFNNQPMIDYFIEALGMDKKSVPPSEKRCFVKINERVESKFKYVFDGIKAKRPILYLHTEASSPIRSLPHMYRKKLVETLLKKTNYHIIASEPGFDFDSNRFLNMSEMIPHFDHFVYTISQADAIVTVDTCTYHIADSFNIPTVVIFSSIEPRYRIKCQTCEAEFSLPRKSHDYNKAYEKGTGDVFNYSHYVSGKDKQAVIDSVMNQSRFSVPDVFTNILSKKTVALDIGCSNGFWVSCMEDKGFDSYGIDVSKIAIDYAKSLMQLDQVAVGNINKMPKKFPKKYDLITAFEIVEHLKEPNDFIKKVYSMLKPGGIFMMSTPNRDRLYFKIGFKNTKKHMGHEHGDYPPEHLQRMTPVTHKTLLERNKFNIVIQKTTPIVISTIEAALEKGFPNMQTVVDGKLIYNGRDDFINYISPLFGMIQGYGNFMITIASKS